METIQPLLMKFRSTLPVLEIQLGMDEEMIFDSDREIWMDKAGAPLYAARATRPYTNVTTTAHTIKGGYTPSGNYKPAKVVPSKTDKRAGK